MSNELNIVKENELIEGIWFEDDPYNNLIEPITFHDYTFPRQKEISKSTSPRLYEVNYNKYGAQMTIIDYKKCDDITIEFMNKLSTGEWRKYIKEHQTYNNFKKGELKSPYDCTVIGVGYMGEGPYTKVNNKKFYSHWTNMLTRCYNPNSWETRPGHMGCSVHPYFQNFQNFCDWCIKNYYEVDGETMDLDKDIMYYGNKVYGPRTCIFIPQSINKLFIRDRSSEKIGIPTGVTLTDNNRYATKCFIEGKSIHLGSFDDKYEAFRVYKEAKEKEIKRVTETYKGKIPDYIYERLISYQVQYRRF